MLVVIIIIFFRNNFRIGGKGQSYNSNIYPYNAYRIYIQPYSISMKIHRSNFKEKKNSNKINTENKVPHNIPHFLIHSLCQQCTGYYLCNSLANKKISENEEKEKQKPAHTMKKKVIDKMAVKRSNMNVNLQYTWYMNSEKLETSHGKSKYTKTKTKLAHLVLFCCIESQTTTNNNNKNK